MTALAAGKASADIAAAIEQRRMRVEEIRAAVPPEPVPFDRAAWFEAMRDIKE